MLRTVNPFTGRSIIGRTQPRRSTLLSLPGNPRDYLELACEEVPILSAEGEDPYLHRRSRRRNGLRVSTSSKSETVNDSDRLNASSIAVMSSLPLDGFTGPIQ